MLVFQGNYKRLATGDYATKRTQAHVEHLKRSIFGQLKTEPEDRFAKTIEKLEPVPGLEPGTDGLQNRCSTN